MKNKFNPDLSKKQCIETGLLLTIVSIVAGLLNTGNFFYLAAAFFALISLAFPVILYPAAIVWFGLAKILGRITSRVLLTVIFFLVLTPVGLIRKWAGKDPMGLKQFKNGNGSVFTERNHRFTPADLEHLY